MILFDALAQGYLQQPLITHGWLYTVVSWPGPHWWQAVTELPRVLIQSLVWVLAIAWVVRVSDAVAHIPEIARLDGFDWDIDPEGEPSLTVVVPARNEAQSIAATLEALLLADYTKLTVFAIDDRSTDATGEIMDAFAAEYPGRIEVMHITELPDGWLGKVFALSVATDRTQSDFLLYTDADAVFSPSILRRSLAYAQETQADHLVVLPTMQVKSWGEGMVLGFFQLFGLWASRLWRVQDPSAKKDIIGVGAFNLVRRSAMEELGGWEPQRMAVLEDITLGRRMKAARMSQRVAFAPGLILVHWAKGARGVIGVMTKNLFSAFNFQPVLLLAALGGTAVLFLLPIAGLFWWSTMVPALMVVCCVGAGYRLMGEASQIDARFAWLYPLGALAFLGAMVRSMAVVLWQGGVVWRGTHYPLRELRQHNSPFAWTGAALDLREEQLQAKKLVKRAKKAAAKVGRRR